MLNKVFSSLVLASVLALGGCQSSNKSSVAEVPPPSPSGPITASHDPALAGPVALNGNTPPATYGAYPTSKTADTFTLGAPTPGSSAPAAPLGGGNYVVRQGDTLWSIARAHYGTGQRWKDIVNANPGLSAERLPVGRAIILP